jgi:hypothetical protein
VSEAGTCLRCGGTRRRPKCGCDPAAGEHAPEARAQLAADPNSASAGTGATVRTLARPRTVTDTAPGAVGSATKTGPAAVTAGP